MQYNSKLTLEKDAIQKVDSLRRRGLPANLILRYLRVQNPMLVNSRKKGGVK